MPTQTGIQPQLGHHIGRQRWHIAAATTAGCPYSFACKNTKQTTPKCLGQQVKLLRVSECSERQCGREEQLNTRHSPVVCIHPKCDNGTGGLAHRVPTSQVAAAVSKSNHLNPPYASQSTPNNHAAGSACLRFHQPVSYWCCRPGEPSWTAQTTLLVHCLM